MTRALLLALLLAALVLAACKKEAPAAPPEAVEEVVVFDLSTELALDVEELGELDLTALVTGAEEPGAEAPTLPEIDVDTSIDLGDLSEIAGP